jgi:glycosyltransferase involved in cell wall biosynthesis
MAPALATPFIVREPQYNAAYWNMHERAITYDGRYLAGGAPLAFYHFSGFDAYTPHWLSKHQCHDHMRPRILLSEHPALAKLCQEYARKLLLSGLARAREARYAYAALPNGRRLEQHERRRYRQALIDGVAPTERPFSREGADVLARWLEAPSFSPPLFVRSPTPSTRRLDHGVNVIGYFRAELGVGQAGRALLSCVQHLGIPYSALAYDRTANRQQASFEPEGPEDLPFSINIMAINADSITEFERLMGSDFFANRYNIALWFWECETFPQSMHAAAARLDEIWVASEFTADLLRKAIDKPVHILPLPILPMPEHTAITRADLGLAPEYCFLFAFDFFSIIERKNPHGLIEAFRKAFPKGEAVQLVIKTINGHHQLPELERLRLAAQADGRIQIIDRYLDSDMQRALFANCDAYVSLHRAEGFGLTLAEAMAHGKPVIATAYSGNLEFQNEENSFLIPYTLSSVGPYAGPYPADALWAEPNLAVAARLMRQVFEHRAAAGEKAQNARADIQENFTVARGAAFVGKRLRAIGKLQMKGKTPHVDPAFARNSG